MTQQRGILNAHLTAGMRRYIAERDWQDVVDGCLAGTGLAPSTMTTSRIQGQ
ncbi:hypothetical protein [Streptomyces sp. NPDC020362]|uniref:hypothetical protein n=1 Tax=unclassified Streptomyces TaxID=2593676 RepID=UPI000AD0434A